MSAPMRSLPSQRRLPGPVRALVTAAVLLLLGCSGTERPGLIESGQDGVTGTPEDSCETGATRECGVTISQASGVLTCYRGQQYCVKDAWSTCTDGFVTKEPDRSSPAYRGFFGDPSLSSPQPCVGNPCDPACMYFDEDPNPNLTPDAGAGGGGGVPNWSRPPGTATCTHELCTTGTPLSPTCHPCVAAVCAVNASCCTGNGMTDDWDAACVDLVFSECVGTTPPVGLNLCDFAAFGTSDVRFGNGASSYPTVGSAGTFTPETNAHLGNVYAKGLVNIRNGAVINGNIVTEGGAYLESPSTITGNVTVGGNIDLRNGGLVTGSLTATGNIYLQASARATGNAWAGGFLEMMSSSRINGKAEVAGGNIVAQSGTNIDGDATVNWPYSIQSSANLTVGGVRNTMGSIAVPAAPVVTLPTLTAYDRDLTASCSIATSRPNINVVADVTLKPGIYGEVTMYSGYNLNLEAGGTYVFRRLNFFSGAGMRLLGTAPWDVNVCQDLHTDTNFYIYQGASGTTLPSATDFTLYSDATSGDGIYIGDNAKVNGMFIAPNSKIVVRNGVTSTAAYWAKEIYTDTGMSLTNIPKADCQAKNLYGTAICDGTTPLYVDGSSYSVGDKAHYRGQIYQCTNAWCSVGGGFGGGAGYWPGEGLHWTATWSLLGACPPPPSGSSLACPVDLDLPALDPPTQACYTGQDCQINSRCTEVLTSGSCAHSKCVVGAKLTSSCDDCVRRICAVDATCCSGTWTAACVSKVATVCDASCGAVSGTPCEHDLCVTGPAITAACSADAADVCAAPGFAYCCDKTTPGTWNQACIDKLVLIETGSVPPSAPPGTSICDYAVMGGGSAALYSTNIVGSLYWYSGAVQLAEQWSGAGRPQVTGDFYNQGSLAISNSDITGAIKAAGAAAVSGSTYASLTAPSAVLPTPAIPTYTMTCPTGGPDNWGASGTLAPGNYGVLQLSGNVTLQAGDYYLNQLNNWSGYTITLPATGNVNIYVCTDVNLNGGAKILSPANDPAQLHLYSNNGVINVQDNAVLWGIFQTGMTSGTVTLGWNVQLHGMAHAYHGVVQSSKGTVIDASGVSGANCLARGIDPTGTPPFTCPVTTPLTSSATESGTCVANGTSYKVSGTVCAETDLAVDLNCLDDTIPVCNHGNTAVPANEAELVFYPRGGQQFATETPDGYWEKGRCTVTSAIPAGGCVNQVCAASLINEDLTVEARLTSSASVTECSILDNWSYYVEGGTCGGAPVDKVYAFEYEAICPDNTTPLWNGLYWDSDTPNASSIVFDARVAKSSADLPSATYLPMGTATSTPDTQVCTSADACRVDITDKIWGGPQAVQPSFLELKITLKPDGADLPTLNDWKITYSCIFDQ